MLTCKLLQREMFPTKDRDIHNYQAIDWDDPIPKQFDKQWQQMIETTQNVQQLKMRRSFYPKDAGTPTTQQLFAFADASDLACCYVVYLRTQTTLGNIYVSFIWGGSMVLPKGTTVKSEISIPRAELCAAETLARKVLHIEKEIQIDNLLPTQYYSDSEDVLAWINNTKDAFMFRTNPSG